MNTLLIFSIYPILDMINDTANKQISLVILSSVLLFIGLAGSVLCYITPSISTLYIGRFLQGTGYSGISVVVPVLARDVLSDKHFAQVASILSLIFGLGPVFSPILG